VNTTNRMWVSDSNELGVVRTRSYDEKLATHIVSKCDCDTISSIFIFQFVNMTSVTIDHLLGVTI
jgi:hypothetical protein